MMLSVTSDFFCYNILINNNTKKQGIKKRDRQNTKLTKRDEGKVTSAVRRCFFSFFLKS